MYRFGSKISRASGKKFLPYMIQDLPRARSIRRIGCLTVGGCTLERENTSRQRDPGARTIFAPIISAYLKFVWYSWLAVLGLQTSLMATTALSSMKRIIAIWILMPSSYEYQKCTSAPFYLNALSFTTFSTGVSHNIDSESKVVTTFHSQLLFSPCSRKAVDERVELIVRFWMNRV